MVITCSAMAKVLISLVALLFLWSALLAAFLDRLSTRGDPKASPQPIVDDPLRITDREDHLFWFIQLSDIHISRHFDPRRAPDLKRFCDEYLDVVKPPVVVVTGDITDSRTRRPLGSEVMEDEWRAYWHAINSSRAIEKTLWLDIRGNHDNFNVLNWHSKNNYFARFSAQGRRHQRHYSVRVTSGQDTYAFLAVDSCLPVGPKRPFNFMGNLLQEDLDEIKRLRDQEASANLTIWFGHYPTSAIAAPNNGLRKLINGPYLCGHYHSIGGLVPKMISTQEEGFMELELSDWKDGRAIRLAAVDHGIFTARDTKLDEWPLVLITNPKDSLLFGPTDAVHRIRTSSHVRALVFSRHPNVHVEARINKGNFEEMTHVKGPLYTLPWTPSMYNEGLHVIEVVARDQDGQTQAEHAFSLDGSRPEFAFGARLLLRTDVRSIGRSLFLLALALTVLPLVITRVLVLRGQQTTGRNRRLLPRLLLLTSTPRLFWPLILIPLYITVGPWFFGHLLDGQVGVVFLWGMVVDDHLLPVATTYILAALQLILFHLPLTYLMAHALHTRQRSSGRLLCATLFFIMVIICHALFSSLFYFSYGWLALATNVFSFWSLAIYAYLWRCALSPAKSVPKSKKNSKREAKELEALAKD